MAIQTFEELLSDAAAIFQQEQHLGHNKAVDSVSALLPAPTSIFPQRRCDERMDYRQTCSYEIREETIAGKSVVIGEGGAFVVNGSREGILLLMALAPHAKQLIEVHISRSRWRRIVSIFEPRWTKSRQVKSQSHGDLFLVGCRRKFGPCEYSSF
jgi:hypothetical protein